MIDLIKPENREEYEKLAVEIDRKHREFRLSIAKDVERLKQLNPIYEIYQYHDEFDPKYTNQTFGQKFSEPFIREHTPNLEKYNGRGHDVRGKNYAVGEIKSSQNDFDDDDWTLNQVKVTESDMLIASFYNARQGTMRIMIAPMVEVETLKRSAQHTESKTCTTIKNTKENHDFFLKYEVNSFEELNEKV